MEKYNSMSAKQLRQLLTLRGIDSSDCVERGELVSAAMKLDEGMTIYDEEGRKIFERLNLRASSKGRYSNLDPIWQHPKTGARVYVGNYVAASTMQIMEERNIRAVVNCQDETSKNYFENDKNEDGVPIMRYHRFHVASLSIRHSSLAKKLRMPQSKVSGGSPAYDGFASTFSFIDAQLAFGVSVLIHCLAGAHRAGTTGVAYLMCKLDLDVDEAIKVSKKCRPIIDPFATLLELLHKLDEELKNTRENTMETKKEPVMEKQIVAETGTRAWSNSRGKMEPEEMKTEREAKE